MLQSYFFDQHLDDEEKILLVVHKHWLVGVKDLWIQTCVFIAVWSILYVVHTKIAVYAIGISALAVAIWWIRNFLDYYLDAWVVTSKGIIDLEWHGWFHRTSTRVLYSDIQGIEYELKGVLGTLLRYGSMSLEKISTGSKISMPYVSKPRIVESVILEAMEAYMHRKNLKDATTVQNILAEFVASSLQKKAVDESAKKIIRKPPVKQ